MRTTITTLTCIFIGLLATTRVQAEVDQERIPAHGVASSVPARNWQSGMLSGNGRMGVIAYGPANSETLVFNHALLWLPTPRWPVIDVAQYWPEMLRLMREKGHQAAMAFTQEKAKQQGYKRYPLTESNIADVYHLAFTLKVETPISGTASDYLRTTDFETGEVAVRWKDAQGGYVRRLFVSRADNAVVVSIVRPQGGKLNLSLTPAPITHPYLNSDLKVEKEWVTYHTAYTNTQGGYDNVARVVAKGGKVESDGKTITVSDADELLLMVRVEWYEKLRDHSTVAIQSSLAALPADYEALLKPHAAEHGGIFNRVRLDIGGGADQKLTSEELLARAKASEYKKVPLALIEKLYDASRYFFISSAGLMPPNLQGIWNGSFTAPWTGEFTTDTNVQMAMDSALSGNMKEGMEGYFRWIEAMLPDWRLNAKRIVGARGILVPQGNSAQYGLNTGNLAIWNFTYWSAGAGWLASYYYDYYLFTGDKKFLAERAVPLMKEAAMFYEDFLSERDAAGRILYRPSFSPEVWVLGLSGYDNSTMDIAVAKELLTNLIASCQELQIEKEHVAKWQTMLKGMPPYGIGPKGDLAEWADNKRPHMYNHRHYSPFYPLWRSFEFTPEGTPELWNASKVSLQMKSEQWLHNPTSRDWPGIPFGRSFHAQVAAYLGQGEAVEEMLNALTDCLFPNMFFSHRKVERGGGCFGFDGHGAYPDVINRSLAFSLRGTLDLLRAVPPGWKQGSIRGILVRGQIKIDSLQWDQSKGTVEVELTSAIDQTITLRLPGSAGITELKVAEGDATVSPSPVGPNARTVKLPAGRKIRLEIKTTKLEN